MEESIRRDLRLIRKYGPTRFALAAVVSLAVVWSVAAGFGTADTNLTTALNDVTTYFSANIGVIITAVIGIAVFFWLLRIAFRSFGVRKPRSVE